MISFKQKLFKALTMLAFACLTACSYLPWGGEARDGTLKLRPVEYAQIAGWAQDSQNEALAAFVKSCAAFAAQPQTAATGQGKLLAPVVVWKDVCSKAAAAPEMDAAHARSFFEDNFVPFQALDGSSPTGLYTGYYEPLLKGSLTRKRPYVYPVYGMPEAGTPAYTRAQIDFNALEGHAPALAYVDDPVQLYFLHVQGSGRVQLDTGETLRLGYAGSNGLPYVSIGKQMVKKGVLTQEEVSMQAIKQWLYDHPNDKWQVLWENTSYVYFRQLEGDPVGTQQVPLTAGRSIAVDDRFIPLGMPVFVDTVIPSTKSSPMTIHRKLMVAQDTGGAIKGPLRADIFFGFGPDAEEHAGNLRSGGTSYVLVPRALAKMIME